MLQPIQQLSFVNKLSCNSTDKSPVKSNNIPKQNNEPLQVNAYYLPANITFRGQNSSTPVEITADYTPKIKSNDHLDLPNVHVFEYPDTKLRVYINNASNHTLPQLNIILEPDTQKYNPIKQALVNKLISYKFSEANLGQYYNDNPQSPSLSVSTNWKTPLPISEIPTINLLLTNSKFDNKNLLLAKQELKEYLLSEEYNDKNQLTEILNKGNLYTKEEVISQIDSIQLNDLQKYYNEYLANAEMQTFLTVNNDTFKDKNLFKELNKNINVTFKTNQEPTDRVNNAAALFIKDRGNSFDVYYLVDTGDVKNDTTLKIISKLFAKYSNTEQENINNYINKEQTANSDIDARILKKDEAENQFFTIAGRKYISTVDCPLTLRNKSLGTPLVSDYYTMPAKRNCVDKAKSINEQKELFEKLLNTDLSNDITEIKTAYKSRIASSLTEIELPSIANKEMTNLKADTFDIYEIVDSITENDIKNYIKTYFLKAALSNNYISLPKIKIQHTAQEVTSNFIPKTKNVEKLDLPNVHVFEYPDTNLKVIINADENIMTADNPYEIMTINNCTRLDEPLIEAGIVQCDTKNFNLVKENVLHTILKNRVNNDDMSILPFAITISTSLTNTVRDTNIADINKIIFNNDYSKEEFETAKKDVINNVKNNSPLSEIFFRPDDLKTGDEIIKELENMSFEEFKSYAENYMNNISMNIYAVVSKDYYEENKDKILSTLNKNITHRLKDLPQEDETTLRINNHLLPEEITTEQFIYTLPFNNLRADYAGNFAIMILNASLENAGYTIECEYTNIPLSLKDNKPPFFETKYCQIKSLDNKSLDKSDLEKVRGLLENIVSEDLSDDIEYLKDWQKDRCETALTKPLMPMIKAAELACMSYRIFSCYESIDSITEDDVKSIINNYLIKQTPVI